MSDPPSKESMYEVVFLDSPRRHRFRAASYRKVNEEYILMDADGYVCARIPAKNVRYIKDTR